jgi:hypothetical protein
MCDQVELFQEICIFTTEMGDLKDFRMGTNNNDKIKKFNNHQSI